MKIKKNFYSELLKHKKQVFEQIGFNPYHIYPWRYERKKNQENLHLYDINKYYIPPATNLKGKGLIQLLESEELNKIKTNRMNNRETVSLGDTIEIDYFHSITSQKIYKYRGVVLGVSKVNSHTNSFKFLTSVGGEYAILTYPFYSPMINKIKILNKSNRGYKRKIFHYHKVNQMGIKLNEMLKGGRNVIVNKKKRLALKKEERTKESIIIE